MRELLGYYTPDMKLADLHVHTNDSPDTRNKGMSPNEVVELADKTGLSAVAITDHHSVRESLRHKCYNLF